MWFRSELDTKPEALVKKNELRLGQVRQDLHLHAAGVRVVGLAAVHMRATRSDHEATRSCQEPPGAVGITRSSHQVPLLRSRKVAP